MSDMRPETTTTTSAPEGRTTVVNTGGGSGGSGGLGGVGGALIGLAVLVAVLFFGWYLIQHNNRVEARGDAVSSAAKSVGAAARKVGDAVTPNP